MLEKEKGIDAVLVATPDHNHAAVSLAAMRHVSTCIVRSRWRTASGKSGKWRKSRRKRRGDPDGHPGPCVRGDAASRRSHSFGCDRRCDRAACLDGPARGLVAAGHRTPERHTAGSERPGFGTSGSVPPPRGRTTRRICRSSGGDSAEFGTGAIGDIGVHNLDTAYWALDLGIPAVIEVKDCSPAIASAAMKDTAPLWSIIELQFPARADKPAVKMTWYDGGKRTAEGAVPGRAAHKQGRRIAGDRNEGHALYAHLAWRENESDMFVLLPRKQFADYHPPPKTLPRTVSHHQEWVDACRGSAKPLSNFGYAARLTESLLLCNVALRTGSRIEWDVAKMRATNCPEADRFIHPKFRKGWSL